MREKRENDAQRKKMRAGDAQQKKMRAYYSKKGKIAKTTHRSRKRTWVIPREKKMRANGALPHLPHIPILSF